MPCEGLACLRKACVPVTSAGTGTADLVTAGEVVAVLCAAGPVGIFGKAVVVVEAGTTACSFVAFPLFKIAAGPVGGLIKVCCGGVVVVAAPIAVDCTGLGFTGVSFVFAFGVTVAVVCLVVSRPPLPPLLAMSP